MAFPTTSVIDAMTRTETPLSDAGKWAGKAFTTDVDINDTSTGAVNSSTISWSSAYRGDITPGADTEIFVTRAVVNAEVELLARIQSPNSAGADGYLMDISGSTWSIWRIDNVAQTQVGSSATQATSAGDSIGFELIGSALKGYRKPSGGAWNQTPIISVTDATYNIAGRIGMVAGPGTTGRMTDFGGGTVIVAAAEVPILSMPRVAV